MLMMIMQMLMKPTNQPTIHVSPFSSNGSGDDGDEKKE